MTRVQWTPEAEAILKAGWSDRLSTDVIARAIKEIIPAMTMNMVVHHIDRNRARLGLSSRKGSGWKRQDRPWGDQTLEKAGCRWPIGDPGTPTFRFCDAPDVLLGKPYCAEHCSLAYRPAEPWEKSAVKPQRQGTRLFGSAA